jgi:hypothetical protein
MAHALDLAGGIAHDGKDVGDFFSYKTVPYALAEGRRWQVRMIFKRIACYGMFEARCLFNYTMLA